MNVGERLIIFVIIIVVLKLNLSRLSTREEGGGLAFGRFETRSNPLL